MRVASFTVPGDRTAVLAWYEGRAGSAGYQTVRGVRAGDETLAGVRGADAFILFFGAPAGGATPVDYVWSRGG